ncbi:hypothetical protein R9C00_07285 [Flammeovirgaceae bacterium SG7u.111]|nr:hypothetical protein [Flammeovirgaceae bacterium SG7u.132]WPO37248.1 hypothetical protein R9C00_07285 [Flammeovirgaceae bacterium SG7u.111]
MQLNPKLISSIVKNLKSIQKNEFDEGTVKNLLIEIRDCGLTQESLLKEICHFVAHPTLRDQGICLQELDVLFMQLKYAKISPFSPPQFNMNPINPDEKRILKNVIEKTPDKYFEATAFSKIKAIEIIDKSYSKKGVLSRPRNRSKIIDIIQLVMRIVIPSGVFSQSDLILELVNSFSSILQSNGIEDEFTPSINERQNDLMVCILSLLQGAKFKLYDGSFAESKMSVSNINKVIQSNEQPSNVNYNGLFHVPYMEDAFSVSIIKTNISFSHYFNTDWVDLSQNKIGLFEVIRKEGGQLLLEEIE